MQAIVTKYLGPTNYRGARVKATCEAGTMTIPWDDALDVEGNHDKAATCLAWKFGWLDSFTLASGGLPSREGNAYVLINRRAPLRSTLKTKVSPNA